MHEHESLCDERIVELQWEEVFGRLQRLRRERETSTNLPRAHTKELLELSRTIREISAKTRSRARATRACE